MAIQTNTLAKFKANSIHSHKRRLRQCCYLIPSIKVAVRFNGITTASRHEKTIIIPFENNRRKPHIQIYTIFLLRLILNKLTLIF